MTKQRRSNRSKVAHMQGVIRREGSLHGKKPPSRWSCPDCGCTMTKAKKVKKRMADVCLQCKKVVGWRPKKKKTRGMG